jgi:hypothetical protein
MATPPEPIRQAHLAQQEQHSGPEQQRINLAVRSRQVGHTSTWFQGAKLKISRQRPAQVRFFCTIRIGGSRIGVHRED